MEQERRNESQEVKSDNEVDRGLRPPNLTHEELKFEKRIQGSRVNRFYGRVASVSTEHGCITIFYEGGEVVSLPLIVNTYHYFHYLVEKYFLEFLNT